jgi:RNA recognition motif-containing protein
MLLALPAATSDESYLLIKNLPPSITEREVWTLFQDSISLEKVIVLPKTNNVYLKFTSAVEIQSVLRANESLPMVYQGQKLKMGSVLKLPLDLNHASRVVLLTLYEEKIEVTAQTVFQLFKDACRPLRIIVFKKKNYQVFVEFDSVEEAAAFKETFDNINFNGFFFLKVQFTRKNSLNITKVSSMEHDFTAYHDQKGRFSALDLGRLERAGIKPFGFQNIPFDCRTPTNMVASLQNFDDFGERAGAPETMKEALDVQNQTRDTSEDKTDMFYVIHLSNVHAELKVKAIFNLFSLYGNIEKISSDPARKKAAVFYETEFEQMTAHHCLANLTLFGQEVDLRVAKVPRTNVSDTQFANLVHYKRGAEGRPTSTLSKLRVINKPNQVLYVFNLSSGASLDTLRALFAKHAQITDIYYSNDTKNSALVAFQSIDDAVKVLCLFKNTTFGDKNLKINFANGNLLKAKDAYQRKGKFVSLQNFNCLSTLLDFEAVDSQPKKSMWAPSPALKLKRKGLGV